MAAGNQQVILFRISVLNIKIDYHIDTFLSRLIVQVSRISCHLNYSANLEFGKHVFPQWLMIEKFQTE